MDPQSMDIPLVVGQVYSAGAAHRPKLCPCLVASEKKNLGRGERREHALPYRMPPLVDPAYAGVSLVGFHVIPLP